MTSRSGHLKNKAGCKEEHAKHLAKEAEKQEELKAKRMALFRPSAAAPGQSESDAGPAHSQFKVRWEGEDKKAGRAPPFLYGSTLQPPPSSRSRRHELSVRNHVNEQPRGCPRSHGHDISP